MKKTEKSPVEKAQQSTNVPDLETLKTWIQKDLDSAIYLMSFVRHRHPEILEFMAKEIRSKAMLDEQGPAVEHVTVNK